MDASVKSGSGFTYVYDENGNLTGRVKADIGYQKANAAMTGLIWDFSGEGGAYRTKQMRILVGIPVPKELDYSNLEDEYLNISIYEMINEFYEDGVLVDTAVDYPICDSISRPKFSYDRELDQWFLCWEVYVTLPEEFRNEYGLNTVEAAVPDLNVTTTVIFEAGYKMLEDPSPEPDPEPEEPTPDPEPEEPTPNPGDGTEGDGEDGEYDGTGNAKGVYVIQGATLKNIADAIRAKRDNLNGGIPVPKMAEEITKITASGAAIITEEKTVEITKNNHTEEVKPTAGAFLSKVTVKTAVTPKLQSKTHVPTASAKTITADAGYDGLSSVAVSAISLQDITVDPEKTEEVYEASDAYSGLGKVTVNPVTKELLARLDSDFKAENIKAGVNILGLVGTHQGEGGTGGAGGACNHFYATLSASGILTLHNTSGEETSWALYKWDDDVCYFYEVASGGNADHTTEFDLSLYMTDAGATYVAIARDYFGNLSLCESVKSNEIVWSESGGDDGGDTGGGSTSGEWLFENERITTEWRHDIPFTEAGKSYTCFVNGEEICTVSAGEYSTEFINRDKGVYLYCSSDAEYWCFDTTDSWATVASGDVSIRINSASGGTGGGNIVLQRTFSDGEYYGGGSPLVIGKTYRVEMESRADGNHTEEFTYDGNDVEIGVPQDGAEWNWLRYHASDSTWENCYPGENYVCVYIVDGGGSTGGGSTGGGSTGGGSTGGNGDPVYILDGEYMQPVDYDSDGKAVNVYGNVPQDARKVGTVFVAYVDGAEYGRFTMDSTTAENFEMYGASFTIGHDLHYGTDWDAQGTIGWYWTGGNAVTVSVYFEKAVSQGNGYHYYFDDADMRWFETEYSADWYHSTGYCPNCASKLSENNMGAFNTECPHCFARITYSNGNVTLRD